MRNSRALTICRVALLVGGGHLGAVPGGVDRAGEPEEP